MQNKYPYLKDSQFLRVIDELHVKAQYVKITVLDWHEKPIKDIQGIVTGGSINIDRQIRSKKNYEFINVCEWRWI